MSTTLPRTPPLHLVKQVVAALQAHGAVVALGGSGLLAALGLIDQVRDWDLTTDAEPGTVETALRSIGAKYEPSTAADGLFRTRAQFVVTAPDHDVEVIVGFALSDGEQVVQLPTRVTGVWRGLPIADPVVWLQAYQLMGRPERADPLQRWLEA